MIIARAASTSCIIAKACPVDGRWCKSQASSNPLPWSLHCSPQAWHAWERSSRWRTNTTYLHRPTCLPCTLACHMPASLLVQASGVGRLQAAGAGTTIIDRYFSPTSSCFILRRGLCAGLQVQGAGFWTKLLARVICSLLSLADRTPWILGLHLRDR